MHRPKLKPVISFLSVLVAILAVDLAPLKIAPEGQATGATWVTVDSKNGFAVVGSIDSKPIATLVKLDIRTIGAASGDFVAMKGESEALAVSAKRIGSQGGWVFWTLTIHGRDVPRTTGASHEFPMLGGRPTATWDATSPIILTFPSGIHGVILDHWTVFRADDAPDSDRKARRRLEIQVFKIAGLLASLLYVLLSAFTSSTTQALSLDEYFDSIIRSVNAPSEELAKQRRKVLLWKLREGLSDGDLVKRIQIEFDISDELDAKAVLTGALSEFVRRHEKFQDDIARRVRAPEQIVQQMETARRNIRVAPKG